jgi:hypothetical protein
MAPKGRTWQELTWNWAFSTGHLASDQKLAAAAEAAWPYAVLYAWTYLNDLNSAHDLMDYAIENTRGYYARHPDYPLEKFKWRMRSSLKRRAKQQASKRGFELQAASLLQLQEGLFSEPIAEQHVYAKELLEALSPFARTIANRRWLGYSWREIARALEMDHTVVRRAFFREVEKLLAELSRARRGSR